MEKVVAVRAGALGHFGDARRAAMGSTLVERVVETGSLVIRKLGGTRAREIAIHRFLSAPSVTCAEMVETLADRTAAACRGRWIVAAQDTTEINFSGREVFEIPGFPDLINEDWRMKESHCSIAY